MTRFESFGITAAKIGCPEIKAPSWWKKKIFPSDALLIVCHLKNGE